MYLCMATEALLFIQGVSEDHGYRTVRKTSNAHRIYIYKYCKSKTFNIMISGLTQLRSISAIQLSSITIALDVSLGMKKKLWLAIFCKDYSPFTIYRSHAGFMNNSLEIGDCKDLIACIKIIHFSCSDICSYFPNLGASISNILMTFWLLSLFTTSIFISQTTWYTISWQASVGLKQT